MACVRSTHIFLVIVHHLIEAIGDGHIFGNHLRAGQIILRNITARNHSTQVFDKRLSSLDSAKSMNSFPAFGWGACAARASG